MSKIALGLVSYLLLSTVGMASDPASQTVDALFASYDKPNSPGCSVGVIHDGRFVFRKSYGEASLELGVPLTAESVFYMASVSKQFTAASIVLAAQKGLVSLDDNVRKYIPELPDYGDPITLRQMLHQTSGFRDFLALTYLSGRDIGLLSSPEDVLKLIVRQKGLNNKPGEDFVYSNSNYFLLGVVLKRATGKSLADFSAENIFRPLGMDHTMFYDDKNVVVKNRVAAYSPSENGGFRVDWSTTYDIVGGGGLMSNLDDLLLWDQNFYASKIGNGSLGRELETHGILNNGKSINYGLGLWLGEYRGLETVEHSGGTFGYRTELLRFPEKHFSIVELCNTGGADVEGIARHVADLYLAEQFKAQITTDVPGLLSDPAPFAGTYLDPRSHMIYTFTATGDTLTAWGAKLRRVGENQFNDLIGNPIVFNRVGGRMTATLTLQGNLFFSGSRVPKMKLGESQLRLLVGDYHSDEINADYHVSFVDGVLSLNVGENPPMKLVPIAPNEFQVGDLGTIVFLSSNRPRLFNLFSQEARGIQFTRTH